MLRSLSCCAPVCNTGLEPHRRQQMLLESVEHVKESVGVGAHPLAGALSLLVRSPTLAHCGRQAAGTTSPSSHILHSPPPAAPHPQMLPSLTQPAHPVPGSGPSQKLPDFLSSQYPFSFSVVLGDLVVFFVTEVKLRTLCLPGWYCAAELDTWCSVSLSGQYPC